jgi:hypothetical protein
MHRIVMMDNFEVKEEGHKDNLMSLAVSNIGQELRESNVDWYLYSNMASLAPKKSRPRSPRYR